MWCLRCKMAMGTISSVSEFIFCLLLPYTQCSTVPMDVRLWITGVLALWGVLLLLLLNTRAYTCSACVRTLVLHVVSTMHVISLSLSLPPSLSLSGFIFICSSWNRTDIATSLTIQYMHIFLHRQATTLFITIKTQTLSYANHVCVVECYERRSRKENHTQKTYTQQSTHYL